MKVVVNGLALYKIGNGTPVLLMPYPHAGTHVSIAEDAICKTLQKAGYSVLTFDPPGAYSSNRDATVDMQEMITCTLELLAYFNIENPIDQIGHSMGSFCALAFALQRQEKVRKLVLVGSTSGWSDQLKYGFHKQWKWWRDKEFWLSRYLGTKIFLGFNNLKTYNQLNNVVLKASFVDKRFVELFEIKADDHKRPVPIRGRWLENVKAYEYKKELYKLQIPVLICVGAHDPQTPIRMNDEMHQRIWNSQLVVFEKSGHFPFVEEEKEFVKLVSTFINTDIVESSTAVNPDCPCPKECARHGHCRDCFEFHVPKGKLPYCKR